MHHFSLPSTEPAVSDYGLSAHSDRRPHQGGNDSKIHSKAMNRFGATRHRGSMQWRISVVVLRIDVRPRGHKSFNLRHCAVQECGVDGDVQRGVTVGVPRVDVRSFRPKCSDRFNAA